MTNNVIWLLQVYKCNACNVVSCCWPEWKIRRGEQKSDWLKYFCFKLQVNLVMQHIIWKHKGIFRGFLTYEVVPFKTWKGDIV